MPPIKPSKSLRKDPPHQESSISGCWCKAPSNDSEIECSNCRSWIHYLCLGLSMRQLSSVINDQPGLYLCKICSSSPDVSSIKSNLHSLYSSEDIFCFNEQIFDLANAEQQPTSLASTETAGNISSSTSGLKDDLKVEIASIAESLSGLTDKINSDLPARISNLNSKVDSIQLMLHSLPKTYSEALQSSPSRSTSPRSGTPDQPFPTTDSSSTVSSALAPHATGSDHLDCLILNELILSNLQENCDLTTSISGIINSLNANRIFCATPNDAIRLGKPKSSSPRLVKLVFCSPFDAKTFKAGFARLPPSSLPSTNLKLRYSLSHAGRMLQRRCTELNSSSAKDTCGERVESFSLRDNGRIWRFIRRDDGVWQRDINWTESSQKN